MIRSPPREEKKRIDEASLEPIESIAGAPHRRPLLEEGRRGETASFARAKVVASSVASRLAPELVFERAARLDDQLREASLRFRGPVRVPPRHPPVLALHVVLRSKEAGEEGGQRFRIKSDRLMTVKKDGFNSVDVDGNIGGVRPPPPPPLVRLRARDAPR